MSEAMRQRRKNLRAALAVSKRSKDPEKKSAAIRGAMWGAQQQLKDIEKRLTAQAEGLEEGSRLRKLAAGAAIAAALAGGGSGKSSSGGSELAPGPTRHYPGVTHRPTYNYKLKKAEKPKYKLVKGKCTADSCEMKRVPVNDSIIYRMNFIVEALENPDWDSDDIHESLAQKAAEAKAWAKKKLSGDSSKKRAVRPLSPAAQAAHAELRAHMQAAAKGSKAAYKHTMQKKKQGGQMELPFAS